MTSLAAGCQVRQESINFLLKSQGATVNNACQPLAVIRMYFSFFAIHVS